MKKNGWILLLIFAAGLLILLFPDNAEPVFSLNSSHGPSFMDLLGLGLILISWLASTIIVIQHYRNVIQRIGRNASIALLLCYFLSLAGIAIALTLPNEFILWASIVIASLINICFIIFSTRPRIQKTRNRL